MSRRCQLLLACAVLAGCGRERNALDFQIAFADEALAARAVRLEARILLGGCDGDEALYVSSFAPDEHGALPKALGSGRYGFEARALDDRCRWYASGCRDLALPRSDDGVAVVTLEETPHPALDCTSDGCDARACVGGMDGGPVLEASTPDATPMFDARADANDDDAELPPADDAGPLLTLELEAESADPLRPPMVRVDDPEVSGGAYVTYPWTSDQTLDQRNMLKRAEPPADDNADGLAIIAFELPAAGQFRLWGRVNVPTLEEDSFWVQIDDLPWVQWNDIAHETPWHWDDVRPFETRNERFIVPLGAGQHRIILSYRELGARLDKFLLTSDLELVPSG